MAWIKQLTSASNLIQGYKLLDATKTLNPPHNYVELDIFQFQDPTIVAECTSFLKRTEIPKVEKFAKIVNHIRATTNEPVQAFFICLAANEAAEKEAKMICTQSDITFICQEPVNQ